MPVASGHLRAGGTVLSADAHACVCVCVSEQAASNTCCSLQQAAAEVTKGQQPSHNGGIMRLRLKEGSHFKSRAVIWLVLFVYLCICDPSWRRIGRIRAFYAP